MRGGGWGGGGGACGNEVGMRVAQKWNCGGGGVGMGWAIVDGDRGIQGHRTLHSPFS